MGLAIAGMHYTAMAAARFAPAAAGPGAGWLPPQLARGVVATGGLAVGVAVAAAIVLGAAVIAAALERGHRRQLARSRDALRVSEARLRAIFEHAAVGIALHDAEGRILEANRAFEQIVGYSRDELRTMCAADLSPAEEAAVTREPVRALKAGACDRVAVEKRFRRKDGALRLCALTVSRVDTAGEGWLGPGLVGMLQDVTEHRALERQLVYRAYHDVLTGLANRARLQERLAEALGAPGGGNVAVLLVDLDGFKLVNDTAGHAAGDALLRQVAERLLHATRGSDLVARLGGDEFAVLLADVRGDADVAVVADRVVAALARPVSVAGTTAVIGASVGIARGGRAAAGAAPAGAAPAGAAEPAMGPVEALLRDADLALYAAKARGRGQYAVFEPAMHAAVVERLALEGALRRGLERGELRLVYQPIVDLATRRLSGVEALVRWQHPTRGLVSPDAFIPLAEETGLIRPLGRWVLEEACRQGAAWAAHGDARGRPPLSVTVNVSGRQLQQPGFVAEVEGALAATGFPATRLVLELTESTVIHHPEVARQRLVALKTLGVRLAIDDFGTGYSALSHLRQFPIDVLKIDKSFVDPIAAGGQPAALAAAIVALGEALSLRTVAEGVESADQAALLEGMGCALAQGYYFSRPITAAAVSAWLDAGAPAPDGAAPEAASEAGGRQLAAV
jgi:diguanylate cyclase (GGDEF)-like protein/PAS domain S-box-containing protein